MYMAMIGMAIIAVPRSIFRALVWLVMGFAAWLVGVVETAIAGATATFSSVNGSIYVEDDGDLIGDCVSVYAVNDSVYVSDFENTPSLMTSDASNVHSIVVNGGDGSDCLRLDAVTEANGFDGITASYQVYLLSGEGNDSMVGSEFDDCIAGSGGNDWAWGADGDDCILGGTGNDCLLGEDGTDRIFGDSGSDTIHGGNQADSLEGGTGADSMAGGVDAFGETGDWLWHNTQAAGSNADGSSDSLWGAGFGSTGDEDPHSASPEEFPTAPDEWNGNPVE
jgi:Ca2+-binding RTX toxin-like protein